MNVVCHSQLRIHFEIAQKQHFDFTFVFSIGEVKLQVARPVVVEEASSDVGVTPPPEDIMAYSIEECQCPEGYAGLSCEVTCVCVVLLNYVQVLYLILRKNPGAGR